MEKVDILFNVRMQEGDGCILLSGVSIFLELMLLNKTKYYDDQKTKQQVNLSLFEIQLVVTNRVQWE